MCRPLWTAVAIEDRIPVIHGICMKNRMAAARDSLEIALGASARRAGVQRDDGVARPCPTYHGRVVMSFLIHLRWTPGLVPGARVRRGARRAIAMGTRSMAKMSAMACLLLCVASGCVMPPAVLPSICGDGFVNENAGEECDDKGTSMTCDIDCTQAVCGDGMVNALAGEECDTEGSSAVCDEDCTIARCGDGTVNDSAGESCDDGNAVSGDGCNADCRTNGFCGDGTLDTGEVCDDGNTTTGDGCSASCQLESCGNGTLEPGETCDDHGTPTETCDSDCTLAECGDGMLNLIAGEQCDHAGMSATCDPDCTLAECGDGVANTVAGEECDTEGNSATCDQDCTAAWCGDGVLNTAAGETCDAGGVDTMSCDRDCTAAECGDGFVNTTAGEQCDTAGESALCDPDCTAAWCGDGEVNAMAGEECDDGNQVDGDGCSACLLDNPGTTLWSHRFGGTSFDYGQDIAVDSAGNVLLTGRFTGTADFGGGPLSSAGSWDIFVGKLDAQGQHLWSRRLGGPGDDFGWSIAVDSAGNVLLTGYFRGTADFGGGPLSSAGSWDAFAVKLDAQGQHLWSRRLGGTGDDVGLGIAVDSAGNVLLTGYFIGTADFGGGPLSSAGNDDIFVVKLDAQGQHLWSRRLGGMGNDWANSVAVDSAGTVLLTGAFYFTADFGGGPLSSAGDYDIFAVKLDPQGQHLWSRRLGGTNYDEGRGIAVDSDGNVLLTGYFYGTADFGGVPLFSAGSSDIFAVKLDPQGQHLWSRRLGGTSADLGRDIAVDIAGNVLLTGYFQGTADLGGGPLSSAGDSDLFAAKLDAQGQHLWSRRLGGTNADLGQGIAVDSAGNALLTGYFYGTADFGGGPLSSVGSNDIFAVKLTP
jgi:cysteine-rich repeat protein